MLLQPPSGGCVLKLDNVKKEAELKDQPPSGGCVLKQFKARAVSVNLLQPPSGGCVLKHEHLTGSASLRSSRLRAAVC